MNKNIDFSSKFRSANILSLIIFSISILFILFKHKKVIAIIAILHFLENFKFYLFLLNIILKGYIYQL